MSTEQTVNQEPTIGLDLPRPELSAGKIFFLSEDDVAATVTQSDVNAAIEACFYRLATGEAFNFDVVRRRLEYCDAIFGFKSGFDRAGPALGLKSGGLWPGNRSRGVPNHQSTIMLFDPESGAPAALVCGTHLTALRTASASALSVRYLARTEVDTLGITANGGQAEAQIRAVVKERSFKHLLLPERASGAANRLREVLIDLDVDIEIVAIEELCRRSDVLLAVALSFEAYVQREWIRPGTHIVCIGTDTVGKQELEAALFAGAAVFGDSPDQNALLGECQHAVGAGLMEEEDITPLGQVISGSHPGRMSDEQITLFDSTGMGMQDLAAASLALAKAQVAGRFTALSQHGR
ncbi:MAG: ornithine cyclodeaminase family protein [Pseudomonadota bacterium]